MRVAGVAVRVGPPDATCVRWGIPDYGEFVGGQQGPQPAEFVASTQHGDAAFLSARKVRRVVTHVRTSEHQLAEYRVVAPRCQCGARTPGVC